jgi:hypothetical protein
LVRGTIGSRKDWFAEGAEEAFRVNGDQLRARDS